MKNPIFTYTPPLLVGLAPFLAPHALLAVMVILLIGLERYKAALL